MDWKQPFKKLEIGKGEIKQQGKETAVLSFGPIGQEVEVVVGITHVNMPFVKPLDENLLHEICSTHSKIITLEEGSKTGGLGSAIAEFIAQNNYLCKLNILGVDDTFVEQDTQENQREEQGLVRREIEKLLQRD